MGTAYSDWYCDNPDCDSEEMIDGDECMGGECSRCGSKLVNVIDDKEGEDEYEGWK